MPIASPVRIGRMQAALVELVTSFLPGTPSVLWGHQQRHRDADDDVRVEIRMPIGPTPEGHAGRGRVYLGPDDATITVPSAIAGVRYVAEINGLDAYTDGVGGDTVTTIRDRLLASLDLVAVDAGVAATNDDPASIILTPVAPGGLYAVRLVALDLALGATDTYRIRARTYRSTIEVQIMVRRRPDAAQSPRNGATDLAARIVAGFESDAAIERLEADGFSAYLFDPPVDLTEISGAETESRSVLGFTVLAPGVQVTPVGTVRSVGGSVLFSEPANVLTLAEIVAP